MSLNGKIAIVTGAAGGIGSAISRELHAQGASVAIADLRADAAKHLAEELNTLRPGSAIAVGVDISSTEDAAAAVDAVRSGLGEVDILVNNAGIDKIERFTDSTPDSWRKIIDVNLLGTITMTRAVLDPMLERGSGRLINIASDAGRVGSSGEVVYSATKGGVIAFTKALAREVAAKGVTSNCICPGPTDTALLGQVAEFSEKLYQGLSRAIPMRRIGQPVDIAPAVAFLAGDGAAFITGQTLSVSGGLTMN
ncbi:SDR family NAD(P)-dependent oxidoreductase [Phytohabitans suffuscus]